MRVTREEADAMQAKRASQPPPTKTKTKEPVPKGPRRARPAASASRKKEHRERFLEVLSAGNTISYSAIQAGVSPRVVYDWRNSDPEFAAEWDRVYAKDGRDALVQEATRRAFTKSDVLLMFLIKQRDPSFRENSRVELTGPGGSALQVERAGVPLAEIVAAARAAGIDLGLPELPAAPELAAPKPPRDELEVVEGEAVEVEAAPVPPRDSL